MRGVHESNVGNLHSTPIVCFSFSYRFVRAAGSVEVGAERRAFARVEHSQSRPEALRETSSAAARAVGLGAPMSSEDSVWSLVEIEAIENIHQCRASLAKWVDELTCSFASASAGETNLPKFKGFRQIREFDNGAAN